MRNHGPANRFRVVAVDGRGKINRVEPGEVELAPGGAVTVNVWMTVPADAAVGTSIDLTVTAESTGAPATVNSVIRPVNVGSPR